MKCATFGNHPNYPNPSMSTNFPVFDLDAPDALKAHLRELGWVRPGEEIVSLNRAGEGNMNLVVRVKTSRGSTIFKQSRPWVEKYPQISAPPDRLLVEAAFYQAVGGSPEVASGMPRLLDVDPATRSALLEDLGESLDCTDLYAGGHVEPAPLLTWLQGLHTMSVPEAQKHLLVNREMRQLNHTHIFDLPMSGALKLNLDGITPGLQAVAEKFRTNGRAQEAVRELGRLYLHDGNTLLHGDYYPGSWLRTTSGVRVIDPEFGFLGPPEFDLGVLQAHLLMAGWSRERVDGALALYGAPTDDTLRSGFAGTEIMRRLLGVAQLPLARTLKEKEILLETAARLLGA